jgi:hypothetical protein
MVNYLKTMTCLNLSVLRGILMKTPKIKCPKCKDDDFVQFDEGIVDGLYCKHCDVLVDEDGNIIQESKDATDC